jgi:tetratricopeptide (TPR) repeat protein
VSTLQQEMATAFRHHQAGEFAQAARIYQQILSREPDQADALHLLGVVRHQQGQPAQAVELISRAVAVRPSVAPFHANLAEAYRALGQLDRAVNCCRTALTLWRDYPEAHNNLGLALQALGQLAEAAEHYEAALALRPNDAQTHSNLGTALRSMGKVEPALEHFKKAVELNPKLASARTNLGQFLIDLGRAEEALPHCREAVVLEPNLAEAHNNLGNAYRAAEQYTDARVSYFEALRINPDLAQSHVNLGLTLQKEGRADEAPPWYRRATELEPTNLSFWGHYADLLTDLDRHPEAIDCYKKMIEIEPERALTYNNLGWLMQESGELDEAKQLYQKALDLQPTLPPALISSGGLAEELGNMDEAEVYFRKALEAHPGHTMAVARLATMLRGKLPDEDFDLLERRLADPSLGETLRGPLLFSLAQVLDAKGQYARAAECLSRSNAVAFEENKTRAKRYEPPEHERFVGNLIAAFPPTFFDRLAGSGLPTRRPVFIFGLPRSGTTLIEQVLASHSQIHGAGELIQGRQNFETISLLMNRNEPPIACLPDMTPEILVQLGERHEKRLIELGKGAERVVDKMPDNYMYLGLLSLMFPNATFIHSRRDLRDIAVSCWMTNFRSIRWANSFEHIANRFQQYVRIMDYWKQALRAPIVEVNYEDTVDDLEGVARRLIAACGLEWEPACLEFHRTERPVRTASVTQVRQPVYKKSVARWKNYEPNLGELFAALPVSAAQPS